MNPVSAGDQYPTTGGNRVRWGAFLLALIGGPLLVTLATFWTIYLTFGALFAGGLPWLVIGGPLFARMVRRGTFDMRHACTAAAGIAFGITAGYFGLLFWKTYDTPIGALIFLPLGAAAYAALWAAAMVWIYTPKKPKALKA